MHTKKSFIKFFVEFRALFALSVFFPFVLTLSAFSDKNEIRSLGLTLFALSLFFLCIKFFNLIDEIDKTVKEVSQGEKKSNMQKTIKYPLWYIPSALLISVLLFILTTGAVISF